MPCKKVKCCSKSNCCQNACKKELGGNPVDLQLPGGIEWIKATDLATVFNALSRLATAGTPYRIVGGNTGTGEVLKCHCVMTTSHVIRTFYS